MGYTKMPHDTRSEVEKVQSLRERCSDVVEPIFQAIGAISERAVPLIRERNGQELGELMNINHGLLEALGVGITGAMRAGLCGARCRRRLRSQAHRSGRGRMHDRPARAFWRRCT